ncbi:DUF982 domain-containing protein [Mesorhizobium sp. IMUNJ 23232]|uniref:DUF982 domain-containing protein n=1 Tax=Mesorhizobium sp. IMUNJ 23232 TaxID=3376064 RepID=UPI0037A6BC7D
MKTENFDRKFLPRRNQAARPCRVTGPRDKEVKVLANDFEKPIRVFVGLGFPRQLNSVVDAYQFLLDYPGDCPEQRAATRACKAALLGDIEAKTARGVFAAFARKKDILIEDDFVPPAVLSGRASHA